MLQMFKVNICGQIHYDKFVFFFVLFFLMKIQCFWTLHNFVPWSKRINIYEINLLACYLLLVTCIHVVNEKIGSYI
jgi:hypothetical protein